MKALAVALLLLAPAAALAEPGPVRGSSMGGDLNIASAPHGAHLRTMGGDIRVGNARGHVIAKTMGGDIRVRDLNGSLLASTMGGNVRVDVTAVAEQKTIQVHSMGGTIEVLLPADFSGTFDIELEQNDNDGPQHSIVSDFPLKITTTRKERWFRDDTDVLNGEARIGTGDARVKITTIGGDIVIRKK